MAVTSVGTLVSRVRRFMGDWPDQDVLTASLASNTTLVSVADGTLYYKNWQIEIDQEVMTIAATGSGTTFPVRRAARGTSATTHATASTVLIKPHFFYQEILDGINSALQDSFPLLYKQAMDATITTLANTFEYNIPNIDGLPMRYVSKVEVKSTGMYDYREVRDYSIRRGAVPVIEFHWEPIPGSTIRIDGYSPFPDLVLAIDALDAQFPLNAVWPIVLGGAAFLTASGETRRVRWDTGIIDDREQANRVGSSMQVSGFLYNRYRGQLMNAAMPPLNKHLRPTF